MKIIDRNNIALVQIKSPLTQTKLEQYLTVKAENPWFSLAYKKGRWDGYYRFFNKRHNTFPAGLIKAVQSKFNAEVVDAKINYCDILDPESISLSVPLRDYQLDALKACYQDRRGVIEVPTGGGKTFIFRALCKMIQGSTLIIVPTKRLMYQTKEVFEQEFPSSDIGLLGDGICDLKKVTIAIAKSATMASIEDLKTFNCVIFDEAHHASADTYYELLLRLPAYYRYGFSADPFDEHNVKAESKWKKIRITGVLGHRLYCLSTENLKSAGVLAHAHVEFLTVEDYSQPQYVHLSEDYQEAYCRFYCENPNLNELIANIVDENPDKSILIIVKHIEHGRALANMMTAPHKFLWGNLASKEINEAIKDFNDGEYGVIIGSPIFNEGIDVPNVDILINAAGDVAATKQRIGRGLRKKQSGDNSVLVYDFIPEGNKHIVYHAQERWNIYTKEGHPVSQSLFKPLKRSQIAQIANNIKAYRKK